MESQWRVVVRERFTEAEGVGWHLRYSFQAVGKKEK